MHYSYEQFLRELGAKLRRMRIERGWTLRDMIVKHGFHLAHWQNFEKGKGMSIPSLLRLCEVFDLTLEELTAGIGRKAAVVEPSTLLHDTDDAGVSPSTSSIEPPKRKLSSSKPARSRA